MKSDVFFRKRLSIVEGSVFLLIIDFFYIKNQSIISIFIKKKEK